MAFLIEKYFEPPVYFKVASKTTGLAENKNQSHLFNQKPESYSADCNL